MHLKFIFVNPFSGGSHRDFAEGLVSHTRHHIDTISLPARFWKWRMRGAALYLIKKIRSLETYQGIITTDLMSLADFKALAGPTCPPTLVYFHENQITYPLAPGETRDFQFGFTNLSSALAAERIVFNSKTHFNDFFSSLPGFLNMMPEYIPRWTLETIREKAEVLYPGCFFPAAGSCRSRRNRGTPLIIWNHRWEFDKNPGDFFDALDRVMTRGHKFRLALLGENFQVVPKDFIAAKDRYRDNIIQYGFVASKRAYRDWLAQGDLIISTARQENFGISIIEGIRHGCFPLLPRRLSYPEIIPEEFHDAVFYRNPDDLVARLAYFLSNPSRFDGLRKSLSEAMGVYAWEKLIDEYDDLLETLVYP